MYYDSFSSPESGLPHTLFAPFFAAGHPVSYTKGQIIYLQGQEPTHLYCLRSGAVRTLITSDAGEERLLTTYGPGSIFGEASFFDGMPRVSTAEAAADCTIGPSEPRYRGSPVFSAPGAGLRHDHLSGPHRAPAQRPCGHHELSVSGQTPCQSAAEPPGHAGAPCDP